MTKNKYIVTVKHGRPSTLLAYSGMNTGTLVQRRQVFRGSGATRKLHKTYYRNYRDNDVETMHKEEKPSLESSIVVRWGSREEFTTDKSTIVYNKSEAIARATDKKESRQIFIDNSVSCPELVTPGNFQDSFLPIVCRPFVHSKGKNFIVLKTESEFRNHYNPNKYYYSQFINKEREFRVHAAHGKVIALMEKVAPENKNNIAWNRAQNDSDPFEYIKWSEIDTQNLQGVIIESLKAVDSLGLDFGGVDVMLKDGEAFVLEVNTSPTLNSSPYVAERWGKYFDWLFRDNSRRDHWDFTQFKKGSSLVWKNYQLADEKKD